MDALFGADVEQNLASFETDASARGRTLQNLELFFGDVGF